MYFSLIDNDSATSVTITKVEFTSALNISESHDRNQLGNGCTI